MNKNRFSSGLYAFLSALVCIAASLLIAFLLMLILSCTALLSADTPFSLTDVINQAYNGGLKPLLTGGFYLPAQDVQQVISLAAPLMMTGLSVGFALKAGLLNIGAAGQYAAGAFGGLLFALTFKLPWYLCLLGAALFGALWGAIPGLFKAYLNISEVITAALLNWIVLYAVNAFAPVCSPNPAQTGMAAAIPSLPALPILNIAFLQTPAATAVLLAMVLALILHTVLHQTTFGYELKACGHAQAAARYAGINEKKNTVLVMTISGALAGFGAGLHHLSGAATWQGLASFTLPGMGFDGIAAALLASGNPLGTILSSLFIAHLSAGSSMMNAGLFPPEIANVLSGVIIYLGAFMMLFKRRIARLFSRKTKGGDL